MESQVLPDIHITNFEGPLDILISLIQQSDISIHDVSISDITNQYLTYLRENAPNMETTSEFQLMASYLIYLKARILMPDTAEEEKNIVMEREAFIDLLLRYHSYRKLAALLADYTGTTYIPRKIMRRKLSLHTEISYDAFLLLRMKNYYIEQQAVHTLYTMQLSKGADVQETKEKIVTYLQKEAQLSFYYMIQHMMLKIIPTFIVLLELAQLQRVILQQEHVWGDILCTRVVTS